MFEQKLTLQGEADTAALGERLSLWVRPGMLVLLEGDLGAGKSTLARAFIRALMKQGEAEDIPSPTFSLIQTYDSTRVPVFHADLYRLKDQSEVDELGLEGLLQTHAGLIEWPDRLTRVIAQDVLCVTLSGRGGAREATLQAEGQWATALQRDAMLSQFIAASPFASAHRRFFEGDASSRRYELLTHSNGETVLLMDMPKRPDGPPVKDGKPYSQIAHLAESIKPVVQINFALKETIGIYSAPYILKYDLQSGLALIEDLGSRVFGRMLLAGENMTEPMLAATEVLASMGARHWPQTINFSMSGTLALSHYDEGAILIESDLLPSWYWPHLRHEPAPQSAHDSFADIWKQLVPLTVQQHPQWVLRDYHSPNLLWLPERKGIARVGLIDTQDAMMGHGAYDLVSMIQDARVDIPTDLASRCLEHYLTLRKHPDRIEMTGIYVPIKEPFDEAAFLTAYAILGAQRATKILGIFARLNKRDGKPAYLKHIPRVRRYLVQNLEHPALSELKAWYATHLSEIFE